MRDKDDARYCFLFTNGVEEIRWKKKFRKKKSILPGMMTGNESTIEVEPQLWGETQM